MLITIALIVTLSVLSMWFMAHILTASDPATAWRTDISAAADTPIHQLELQSLVEDFSPAHDWKGLV
jgi:hypothetical protein